MQVLQLAARRDPEVLDAAQKLAAMVLGDDELRLALNVALRDPFAVVHAVELAALVIARSTDAVPPGHTGNRAEPRGASPCSSLRCRLHE
jgi:hypothetical protein